MNKNIPVKIGISFLIAAAACPIFLLSSCGGQKFFKYPKAEMQAAFETLDSYLKEHEIPKAVGAADYSLARNNDGNLLTYLKTNLSMDMLFRGMLYTYIIQPIYPYTNDISATYWEYLQKKVGADSCEVSNFVLASDTANNTFNLTMDEIFKANETTIYEAVTEKDLTRVALSYANDTITFKFGYTEYVDHETDYVRNYNYVITKTDDGFSFTNHAFEPAEVDDESINAAFYDIDSSGLYLPLSPERYINFSNNFLTLISYYDWTDIQLPSLQNS